jgi:hypothetical protein
MIRHLGGPGRKLNASIIPRGFLCGTIFRHMHTLYCWVDQELQQEANGGESQSEETDSKQAAK